MIRNDVFVVYGKGFWDMNHEVENVKWIGKGGISAKVLADSTNIQGDRVTTFELEYPRFIHSEFMTHRMLSRNAASSRAIPVKRNLMNIILNTAAPIHWGRNQAGMQASEENSSLLGKILWGSFKWMSLVHSYLLSAAGYHKQIANRPSEIVSMMKIVVTATDWDNFLWLRNHKDAQPEIQELARCIHIVREYNIPKRLKGGDWHLPYIDKEDNPDGSISYLTGGKKVSLEDAIKVSVSCCAQVSYRTLDTEAGKAKRIYDRLISSKPAHASPWEHVCTPVTSGTYQQQIKARDAMYEGFRMNPITEANAEKLADQAFYVGNLRGFIQLRKTIEDENMTKPFKEGEYA